MTWRPHTRDTLTAAWTAHQTNHRDPRETRVCPTCRHYRGAIWAADPTQTAP